MTKIIVFVFIIFIIGPVNAGTSTATDVPESLLLQLHTDPAYDGSALVQFTLPVPPDLVIDPDRMLLLDGEQSLPIKTEVLAYWPDTFKQDQIRALLITAKLANDKSLPDQLLLKLYLATESTAVRPKLRSYSELTDVRKNWQPVKTSLTNPQPKPILEPAIYVTLPPEWLSRCLLKTYTQPLFKDRQFLWFDQSTVNFGKTAVNESLSGKFKPIDFNRNEPWMFDRVANLYHLYIRTGDIHWLKHAHRAAQFYAQHINQKGYLEIDHQCHLKCSYAQGLWMDYLLTGDKHQIEVIKRIEPAGKRWFPRYSRGLNFFTERHQSYAFWALLTAWEAFPGDSVRYQSVKNFFEQTHAGINQPPSGWLKIGCYQHQFQDHEGEGTDQAICSPWMSALLAEVIWKYYLLTDDSRALEVLSGFGDYLVNYATYRKKSSKLKNAKITWLPYYIAGSEYKFKQSPGTDRYHSCDISGLLARSVWAKRKLGLSNTLASQRLSALLDTCRNSLYSVSRKNTVWPIAPYRKYNWEFGSTHDLSWLLQGWIDLPQERN